ncbi:hypothetical protein SAMN04487900_1431 [Prevotella communis]|uniref:Uncharacterized protein n=1 Tax=Prevotella communis TaxID=2913614 RepID=A0A1H0L2J6_9BACT|nr:hypothetical protein [Prevotella communis]SDO62504.1 hypothetical protein SAMN04487900_1431 [Prevotella communis]
MRKNKLLLLLALLLTAATGARAQDYYAPSTDEVIILNDVYDDSKNGYSSHSAIAWEGTASDYSKKAGDPNNGGQPTSSTVSCYSVKGTGQGKNITLSITGVSKVIVYHERNSSRYIELRDGSKTGNIIGSGQTNTYYTEVELTATNEYSIFLHGTRDDSDQDFYVYAIKLIAAPAAPAAAGYTVSLKDGVKDADKWTVKVGEGQAQALPIGGLKGDGKETVTLQYNGRLKVKGVTATSDAAPAKEPATVTTAPTGAAIVGVGKTTALVSGGVADGGTLMYAVTTTNTKPASTDGFSDAVPTAQTINASGKVYVWYYVKGDDTHTDSEIAATAIEVPVADIVWDATNVFNSAHQFDDLSPWHTDPLNYEGITISFSGDDSMFVPYGGMGESMLLCYGEEGESFTFTAPSGKKFCKIEINDNSDVVFDEYGDWTSDEINHKIVWSGTAANAVTLGTVYTVANNLNSIGFYLSE